MTGTNEIKPDKDKIVAFLEGATKAFSDLNFIEQLESVAALYCVAAHSFNMKGPDVIKQFLMLGIRVIDMDAGAAKIEYDKLAALIEKSLDPKRSH